MKILIYAAFLMSCAVDAPAQPTTSEALGEMQVDCGASQDPQCGMDSTYGVFSGPGGPWALAADVLWTAISDGAGSGTVNCYYAAHMPKCTYTEYGGHHWDCYLDGIDTWYEVCP